MTCKNTLTTIILPFSILLIHLFQIYSQYSTLVTLRSQYDNINDGRNTAFHYELSKTKQYDFNINKVEENFEDNVLMNINFFKKMALKFFESLTQNQQNIDYRFYMLYYLFLYDLIILVIVYIFIYGSFKAGVIKIIIQLFRFYFTRKRMQTYNRNLSVKEIIRNKLDNFKMRGWGLFNSEGFFVIEYLCNFIIVLDIFYLIVIFCQNRAKNSKNVKKIVVESSGDTKDYDIDNDTSSENDNKNKVVLHEKKSEDDSEKSGERLRYSSSDKNNDSKISEDNGESPEVVLHDGEDNNESKESEDKGETKKITIMKNGDSDDDDD